VTQANALQRMPNNQHVTHDIDHLVHLVSEVFCPMECRSHALHLDARMSLGQLDKIRLATVASKELKVVRNRSHIAQATENYYLVKFQLAGTSLVRHRSREAELKAGDFVICSSSDPYELHFPEPYHQAILSIPQFQLNDLVTNPEQYLGQTMQGDEPVNGMLSQFVYSLTQRLDKLAPTTLRRIEANVLDLLITSLEAQGSPDIAQTENTQQEHLSRIKQFIAMHLHDSRLSPDFIAQAEGIGTRYLHMLFKHEPLSVSRYIQAKRLEACSRALIDPNLKNVSTTDIAYECGFNDVSHFHRCFKAQYGVTPRQYRLSVETK
jgi:AraC-like DNA-binding protein